MVRKVDGSQRFQPTSNTTKKSKAASVAATVQHLNPNHVTGSLAGRVTSGRPTGEKQFSGGFGKAQG